MKLYVAAATILEIEPLMESPQFQQAKLVITGIGLVRTTYQLTKLIKDERPDLIIQAGIAGAFNSSIPLGSVRIVKTDCFADLGVEENGIWKDIYDLGLAKPDDEPFKKGWLVNDYQHLAHLGIPLASSITITEITTNESRIGQIRKRLNPDLESMEGGSLHFVCLQEKIPFIQLRAISNYVGEREKSRWELKLAIKNLNQALIKLIEELH